jgi:prephenate dehydratase
MNKVHVLGPVFSYSYNLAKKLFKAEIIVCEKSIEDVFEAASGNESALGIVPMENMLNGTVRESLFALEKFAMCIEKAYDFHIENVLAAKQDDFTRIASHPQPLAQCSQFLKDKNVEIIETSSTSQAMEMAAKDGTIAAIGNREAAEHYGLIVAEERISNRDSNITRFIGIRSGAKGCSKKGRKTSMIIKPMEDRAGLLFEILSVFEIKKINLTKIESIPTGNKMNDYIFYIDIDGALEEKRITDAIEFLKTFVQVDIFGSYDIEEK